jgi:WW domain-binding protein 4
VKREAEAPPDDEDARAFKLRKKTLNTGLGEIYDPGLIPIKIKKKEKPIEPKLESLLDSSSGASTNSQAPMTGAPKWTSLQWKRPGDPSQPTRDAPEPTTTSVNVKTEIPTSTGAENASSTSTKWAKPQWSEPLPDFQQDARNEIFENTGQKQNGSPTDNKADVKVEPDVKTEGQPPQLSEAPPASSLFKKRKAPTGAGRGRRQV